MPALRAVDDLTNWKSWAMLRRWIPVRAENARRDSTAGTAANNSSRGTHLTVEPDGHFSGKRFTTRYGSTSSRKRASAHTWRRCGYTFTPAPINWHNRRRSCTNAGDAEEMKQTPTPRELVARQPS